MQHGNVNLAGFRIDLDLFEKIAVSLLLGGLAIRLIPDELESSAWISLLLLLSEACVVVFVLLRRPTNTISLRTSDWLLGFGGTLAALLAIPPGDTPLLPMQICGALLLTGFAIQLAAKFTLRRSFGVVAANRGVKASGPYRIVRHPMYAGYLLTHVAFVLSGPNIWNVTVYSIALALNVARLIAEERVLMQDEAYRAMCRTVRYRLVPFLF